MRCSSRALPLPQTTPTRSADGRWQKGAPLLGQRRVCCSGLHGSQSGSHSRWLAADGRGRRWTCWPVVYARMTSPGASSRIAADSAGERVPRAAPDVCRCMHSSRIGPFWRVSERSPRIPKPLPGKTIRHLGAPAEHARLCLRIRRLGVQIPPGVLTKTVHHKGFLFHTGRWTFGRWGSHLPRLVCR
jgi:hypothetical protein